MRNQNILLRVLRPRTEEEHAMLALLIVSVMLAFVAGMLTAGLLSM